MSASSTDAPPVHCLVVEDDPVLLEAIGRVLAREGHRVTLARDGVQALERFAQDPAELVITDIIMPEKEGVETILSIKGRAPDVRVVAISGGGRTPANAFLQVAKALGADATLAKPFTLSALMDVVRSLIPPRAA